MKWRKCCGRRANLPHASTCPTRIVPTERAGVFKIRLDITLGEMPDADHGTEKS